LEEVDRIPAQQAQALLDAGEHGPARPVEVLGAVAELGRQGVASRVAGEGRPEDRLRAPADVALGGVQEGDPQVERAADRGHPVPDGQVLPAPQQPRAAEPDLGHFQVGAAQPAGAQRHGAAL
jgi:hypothetical protein